MTIHLLKFNIEFSQYANPYVNTEVQILEILPDQACTNEDLSKHCLKGLTQNQWVCCVKNEICGKIKVDLTVWCSLSFQFMYTLKSFLFQLTISTNNNNRVATFLGGYCCHLKEISSEIVIVVNYLGIPYILQTNIENNSAEISRVGKML